MFILNSLRPIKLECISLNLQMYSKELLHLLISFLRSNKGDSLVAMMTDARVSFFGGQSKNHNNWMVNNKCLVAPTYLVGLSHLPLYRCVKQCFSSTPKIFASMVSSFLVSIFISMLQWFLMMKVIVCKC